MQFCPGNDMTRQREVVIGTEAAEVLLFPSHSGESGEATLECVIYHWINGENMTTCEHYDMHDT